MPKFSNREEYERWKKEKLGSNLDKIGGIPGDRQIPESEQEEKSDSEHSGIQPVAKTVELKSISDLFSNSWELFKNRFWTLNCLYLLSAFFLIVFIGVFLGISFLLSMFFPEHRDVLIVVGVLVGMIPGFTGMFWGFSSFILAVTNEELGLRDSLRHGWHKVLSFMWLYNLTGFIITGGFLLLIIPGIIFLVWFAFAQFILASEDERGMKAILKSKEYVRGKWLDVFLRLFIVWIMSGCVGMVPVIGPIVSLLFFPFVMIFIYLVYKDLKEIKGDGVEFPQSAGEKAKWLGAGALGYVLLPLLLLGIFGATIITMSLLLLKGLLTSH
jgi:hypothetical protein